MSQLSEILEKVLQALYPGIVFDAEELVSLLLPCAAIVLVGLIVSLLIKLPRASRRFAHLPVVIALMIAITASSFFPATLMRTGQGIMSQIQQMTVPQDTAP